MFGRRFFGIRYFGSRYWGEGGAATVIPVLSAAMAVNITTTTATPRVTVTF